MTRRTLSVLLVMFFLGEAASGSAVELVRVWPGYRSAASFESIGEYFGREEFTGGRLVLRTQPDDRDGYYFLTRIKKTDAILNATAHVQLIFEGNSTARSYRLPVDIPAGQTVLNIGITGKDWPGASVKPIAWRVALLRADGTELVSAQSFLWAQP